MRDVGVKSLQWLKQVLGHIFFLLQNAWQRVWIFHWSLNETMTSECGHVNQLVFSSPEPKAQVSFSDQNLSVVRRRCRCCFRKLFTFWSSSPEPLVQFQPNLAPSILGWFVQMKGLCLSRMSKFMFGSLDRTLIWSRKILFFCNMCSFPPTTQQKWFFRFC